MSGKLSEKFANLGAAASSKPKGAVRTNSRQQGSTVSDRIREARANSRKASQQSQRQAQTQQRRTGVVASSNNNNNNKPRGNNVGKTNVKGKGVNVRGNIRPGSGRSKGSAKGGQKGGKPQGKRGPRRTGGEKKKPVSAEDLDKEMDTYWFEAGKGPNPVVAALDKEMDDYFQTKQAASATAGDAMQQEAGQV